MRGEGWGRIKGRASGSRFSRVRKHDNIMITIRGPKGLKNDSARVTNGVGRHDGDVSYDN